MDNSVIKKIITYTIIASFFITGPSLANLSFSFHWFSPFYILFILYSFIILRKINLRVTIVLVCIVVYSLTTYKSDLSLVVKQLANIITATLVAYGLFLHENHSIERLVQRYARFAQIILIIGFFQVLCFVSGYEQVFLSLFPFLESTNISVRFQSLSDEPSFIALTFAPLVFLSLHNLLYRTHYLFNRGWSYLFVLSYLLTFASSAYIAMALMLFTLYFKNFSIKKLLLASTAVVIICLFSLGAYLTIPMIQIRVDDTFYGLSRNFENPDVYRRVNLSTYSLLSNWHVTKKGLGEFPVTGRGLGTHESTYESHLPKEMIDYAALNNKDANSMAMRLLTETGIIGFLLFLFFTFKYKISPKRHFNDFQDFLWIVNGGIFITIIIILLRNGNYTSNGKVLFFLLYYYSYRFITNDKTEKELNQF